MDIRILVMNNRFVSVGVFSEEESEYVLDNAAVIRRWGTTHGLGEIAAGGPTDRTKLDKTPREFIPKNQVIKMIACDVKKWKKHLDL